MVEAMGGDGDGLRDGLARQEFNTMLEEGSTQVGQVAPLFFVGLFFFVFFHTVA